MNGSPVGAQCPTWNSIAPREPPRSFVPLLPRPLRQAIECHDIRRVGRCQVRTDCVNLSRVSPDQLCNVPVIPGPTRGEFQLDQRGQRDVAQRCSRGTHGRGVRQRSWRGVRRRPGPLAFRKDVHLDIGLLVHQFGPAAGRLRQDIEAGKCRHSQKFVNPIGGKDNIHVSGDATVEAVAPYCPATAQHGFGVNADCPEGSGIRSRRPLAPSSKSLTQSAIWVLSHPVPYANISQ